MWKKYWNDWYNWIAWQLFSEIGMNRKKEKIKTYNPPFKTSGHKSGHEQKKLTYYSF